MVISLLLSTMNFKNSLVNAHGRHIILTSKCYIELPMFPDCLPFICYLARGVFENNLFYGLQDFLAIDIIAGLEVSTW